jgi:hypothetical protein
MMIPFFVISVISLINFVMAILKPLKLSLQKVVSPFYTQRICEETIPSIANSVDSCHVCLSSLGFVVTFQVYEGGEWHIRDA